MVRFETSAGSSQNENVSDNAVHLFLVKDQFGQDSTYYTARYNTTPSDNSGYVVSTTYSEPLWKGARCDGWTTARSRARLQDAGRQDMEEQLPAALAEEARQSAP